MLSKSQGPEEPGVLSQQILLVVTATLLGNSKIFQTVCPTLLHRKMSEQAKF